MIGTVRSPAELRGLAEAAAVRLEGAPAEEILRWAADEFGAGLAVSASMQDTVLAHLASRVVPGLDVLFLDTGYHFVETLGTADAVEAVYPVRLRRLLPLQTVAEQDARYGSALYARDPDLCCALRKVAPMNRALEDYEAWATGLRRAESASRAATPVVAFDERRQRVKIAPLAAWTDDDVDRYISAHGVLVNPLLSAEYPSIGCEPCTRAVRPGDDPRSGRWAGRAKTECGLHT
ncbi:phosphoadenylyl-sulfate reductase [Nakamurella endophytica]|uniref:Adenosine 5'-phosphosulfate reductase n=1 Tax=Nakamurella endophytica TaxID=1748367 RepID=A0A917SMC7_9ACTN|nr:phosphoadenylyl-sulfate reductase [Nakamurella endophytica]GGL86835.1 phosphoadenosine phosphosulfate reductase [Nakamurella endophytica]